jgi:thioredoxin-related protein|tara:strand:+ start:124 stop:585 length:462 start_codon:yes stop_codon:yes gene_type:complete
MPVNFNLMNKYLLLFIFCVLGFTQLHAQQWLTNFQQAKELSTTQEKTILLVFQGSDWCAPCIKLNREIFESEPFIAYAKDHFIMLQADFPRRKKNALDPELQTHNNALAERYNKGGVFPFVVVLNKDGRVLGQTSYSKKTPQEYIVELEGFIK